MLIVSLLFIAAAIVSVLVFFIGISLEYLFIAVMTIVFLIPVVHSFIRNKIFDEPIFFVGISFVFFYSISSLGYFYQNESNSANFISSVMVITIGFAIICISYYFFAKTNVNKYLFRLQVDFSNSGLIWPSILILLVGFYALYRRFEVANVSIFLLGEDYLPPALLPSARETIAWNIPLQIAPIYSSMVLFMVGKKRENKMLVLFSVLSYLLALWLLLMLGSRSRIMISLLSITAMYYYFSNNLKRYKIAIITLFLLVFFVLYGSIRGVFFAETKTNILDEIKSFKTNDYILHHGDAVSFRATVDILNTFPDKHQFLWGTTLVTPVTNYIPRILWPGKPISAAAKYTRMFYPESAEIGVSSTTGIIGELYMNGGIIFVVVFAFLVGIFLKKIKLPRDKKDVDVFIYANLLPPLVVFARGDFCFFAGIIINFVLISYFIFFFGRGRSKNER